MNKSVDLTPQLVMITVSKFIVVEGFLVLLCTENILTTKKKGEIKLTRQLTQIPRPIHHNDLVKSFWNIKYSGHVPAAATSIYGCFVTLIEYSRECYLLNGRI